MMRKARHLESRESSELILNHHPLLSVTLASPRNESHHAGPILPRLVERIERDIAIVVHPRKLNR